MINDIEIKPTFGTGIHSVSPAHNIEDLRVAEHFKLSVRGCVDPDTGFLTSPDVLAGTDLAQEEDSLYKIVQALSAEGQFYKSF